MKKENFIALIMGTVGGILFALGMCMCLLPQWNAFGQGVALGAAGAVVLIAMLPVRRKMLGKPAIRVRGKTPGTIALGLGGALVPGPGLCMTMVWEGMLIPGILVGPAGIGLLFCLIPLCRGLR